MLAVFNACTEKEANPVLITDPIPDPITDPITDPIPCKTNLSDYNPPIGLPMLFRSIQTSLFSPAQPVDTQIVKIRVTAIEPSAYSYEETDSSIWAINPNTLEPPVPQRYSSTQYYLEGASNHGYVLAGCLDTLEVGKEMVSRIPNTYKYTTIDLDSNHVLTLGISFMAIKNGGTATRVYALGRGLIAGEWSNSSIGPSSTTQQMVRIE